jgi:hypothetical protein
MKTQRSTIQVARAAMLVAVTLAAVAVGSLIRQPDAPSGGLGANDDWFTRHPVTRELGPMDDYAGRHMAVGELGPADDWFTRHAVTESSSLGPNDDYGTRNVEPSADAGVELSEADDYGTRNRRGTAPTRFGPPGR